MAKVLIADAKRDAILKHGSLQGGMDRWFHHLQEEAHEALDDILAISKQRQRRTPDYGTIRQRRNNLMTELAQVAQLAEGMLVLLILGDEHKGEETWKG
jgi:hypothetical protein